MHLDTRSLQQTRIRRLPHACLAALAAAAAVWCFPGLAIAQDSDGQGLPPPPEADPGTSDIGPSAPDTQPSPPSKESSTPEAEQSTPITFQADQVDYHEKTETFVASGNVLMRRDDQSLRADQISWNAKSGQIIAEGNVRLVDESGNQLFTDQVTLTDKFDTGAMENMLLALRQGGRLAAKSGTRMEDGRILLHWAAYTSCPLVDSHGCPKTPSWKLTARKVIYDPKDKRIRFGSARLDLFGFLKVPLPGLKMTTDGRAISGLLIPDFRFTPSNGVEISDPYFLRLSNNRDLTATAYMFTDVPPMVSLQYRSLTSKGAYQITGYATESSRIPISGVTPSSQRDFRGYIFANGRFQFTPNWSVTASIRRTTDRTFLRRYDISYDDRLRSMVDVERIDGNSYFSFAGWSTQTMRVGALQGQVPIALPVIDYRRRLANPVLGGRVELQANSLAISRTAGQDTQRAFASARWDLRKITSLGQVVTFTALLRGDIYHSAANNLTPTPIYRGNPGWQSRGVAIGAIDVKWPLVGKFLGGTQVLTPHVQLVATPPLRNLAVPNEDSRAIELEDSNLFALNRFPGYDRIEDGQRVTYGFDWQYERPRWRIRTTIGQSVRLTDKPTLFPAGTGLSGRVSDIVGRTEIRYRNFLELVHRFRLDKNNFAVRRNEFDATIGNRKTYAEVSYSRLNRILSPNIEDLKNDEELRFAVRTAFAHYWSLFGSGVLNLGQSSNQTQVLTTGFQPLRTRVGVSYQDDCLEISLTWRRDYITTGDVSKGNTFQIHFALRNIGTR